MSALNNISIDGMPIPQADVKQPTSEEAKTQIQEVEATQTKENANVEENIESTIKLDDFLKLASQDSSEETEEEKPKEKTPEEKDEEFKEDEPTKEVEKKSEEVIKPTKEQTVEEKKTTRKDLVTQDLKTRDVAGLDEDLAPLFKDKMSRSAYDKLKPIVLEHKQLKTERDTLSKEIEALKKDSLPANYYEHDKGFLLSPEFENISNAVNDAETIYNHWRKELASLEDGANEVNAIGYNQNGQLIITGKVPANKETERALREQISLSQHQLLSKRNEAQQFVNNFKNNSQAANQWLSDFESKAFSYFNTEEGKQHLNSIKELKNQLPRIFASSRLAEPLAKSLFLLQASGNMLNQLRAENAELKKNGNTTTAIPAKVTAQRKAGPTASESDSGASRGDGSKEITFDMFQQLKEQE